VLAFAKHAVVSGDNYAGTSVQWSDWGWWESCTEAEELSAKSAMFCADRNHGWAGQSLSVRFFVNSPFA